MPYPNWAWNNPMPTTVPYHNGYFPATQYPNMQPYTPHTVGANSMPNNFTNVIRVTGLEGAKAYPLGPNSSVVLFDETENEMYIKTTDGAGFPTIHTYIYDEKIVPADQPIEVEAKESTDEYVSKAQYEQLCKQMESMQTALNEIRKAHNGQEHIQSGSNPSERRISSTESAVISTK